MSCKRYRYTAKERDTENGFTYHGARYYAPWLARWTACDKRGARSDFNLYYYCYCRPTSLLDRDGRNPGLGGIIAPPTPPPPPFIMQPPPPPVVAPPPPVAPPVEPPISDARPRSRRRALGTLRDGLGPLLVGAYVFFKIMLTPSNADTDYTVTYKDPDTGQTLRFHDIDALEGYKNCKATEKRIAPGAGDGSPRSAPGADAPGGDRQAPGAADQTPQSAPPPEATPTEVNAPGQSDRAGETIVSSPTADEFIEKIKSNPKPIVFRNVSMNVVDQLLKKYGPGLAVGLQQKGTIASYEMLAKIVVGLGGAYQTHHIIEQQVLKRFGYSLDQSPAVIMTKQQHEEITAKLAKLIKPEDMEHMTRSQLRDAYLKAYAGHPEWQAEVRRYFR